MRLTLIFILIFSSLTCFCQEKDPDVAYFSCQIIEKPFINKIGSASDRTELYLRCSMDDFFIKFCESDVTMDDIQKYVNAPIMVDVEIKDGNWDICPEDPDYAQSRVGAYAVIHEILERD